MGRAPCCEKIGLNRGPWTREEDILLTRYISVHGEGSWRTLPKAAGLRRCGKSCRLRWINYLRPDVKRGNITEEEDQIIIKLHSLLGNRWSLIAGRLPGRTDNEIKNYWNTHLKKKLRSMGIDPHTHRPLNEAESENAQQNGKKCSCKDQTFCNDEKSGGRKRNWSTRAAIPLHNLLDASFNVNNSSDEAGAAAEALPASPRSLRAPPSSPASLISTEPSTHCNAASHRHRDVQEFYPRLQEYQLDWEQKLQSSSEDHDQFSTDTATSSMAAAAASAIPPVLLFGLNSEIQWDQPAASSRAEFFTHDVNNLSRHFISHLSHLGPDHYTHWDVDPPIIIPHDHLVQSSDQLWEAQYEHKAGIELRGYVYERLDGSVRAEERFAAVRSFSSPHSKIQGVVNNDVDRPFVFLLTTRAGGVGLNLAAADTVIFYEQDWNPQADKQALQRAHRIGQHTAVLSINLITQHTIEEPLCIFHELVEVLNKAERNGILWNDFFIVC